MEGDKENKKIRGLFRYICLTKDGQAIFSRWNSRILDKYLIIAVFFERIYIIGVNAESTDELSRETIWQLLKTLRYLMSSQRIHPNTILRRKTHSDRKNQKF